MKYSLITKSPLALARKPIDGKPILRTRDNLTGVKAPTGCKYIPNQPKPSEAPQDGYRWARKLSLTSYGWQEVAIVIPEPQYGEVSTRIFFKRMTALGKWRQFKQLIKQTEEVEDLYDNSAGLDLNDPDVIALSPAIKASIGLTDEEYKSLFLLE